MPACFDLRRALLLLAVFALFACLASGQPQTAFAEEKKPDGEEKDGEDDGNEPGANLGERDVSFMKKVNWAIEYGVNWLKAKPAIFEMKKGDEAAHWGLVKGTRIYGGGQGPQYRHPAGPTALALYTLLKCGVDPKDPVIVKGFNWLKLLHRVTPKYDGVDAGGKSWTHTQAAGSYEYSVMILALTAKWDQYKKSSASKTAQRKGKLKIRDREDKEWLIELVEGLVARRGLPDGTGGSDGAHGWRYNVPKLTLSGGNQTWTRNSGMGHIANQDLSSTQLAALALSSAHRFGVKPKTADVWIDIVKFTLDHQEPKGPEHERHDPVYDGNKYAKPMDHARGFCYIKDSPEGSEGKATGSMTACGVTNLLIAAEILSTDKKYKKTWEKAMLSRKVNKGIWDGIAWLDKHWTKFENPYSKYGYHIYYWYAIERAMDILNKKLCGSHLWYKTGAEALLANQNPVRVKVRVGKKQKLEEVDGTFWQTNSTHEPKDVIDTCFALLFLKRATRGFLPTPGPVVTGE